MITARELTELVLKFEELKEKHNLNYIIYTNCFYSDGEFAQAYKIQSLEHFGELLTEMNEGWKVEIIHITSHIGKKVEE